MARAKEKVDVEKRIVAAKRHEFGQASAVFAPREDFGRPLWTFDLRLWVAGEARAGEWA
jgi:hypothetical protein